MRFLWKTFIMLKFLVNPTESDFHRCLFIMSLPGSLQKNGNYQVIMKEEERSTLSCSQQIWSRCPHNFGRHYPYWDEQPLTFSSCTSKYHIQSGILRIIRRIYKKNTTFFFPGEGLKLARFRLHANTWLLNQKRSFFSFGFCNRKPSLRFFSPKT